MPGLIGKNVKMNSPIFSQRNGVIDRSGQITQLPDFHIKTIGQMMNRHSAAGMGDFKHLASELGLAAKDMYPYDNIQNPGYQLIIDWTQRTNATIHVLLVLMRKIQREDIYVYIEECLKDPCLLVIQIFYSPTCQVGPINIQTTGQTPLGQAVSGELTKLGLTTDMVSYSPNPDWFAIPASQLKGQQINLQVKNQTTTPPISSESEQPPPPYTPVEIPGREIIGHISRIPDEFPGFHSTLSTHTDAEHQLRSKLDADGWYIIRRHHKKMYDCFAVTFRGRVQHWQIHKTLTDNEQIQMCLFINDLAFNTLNDLINHYRGHEMSPRGSGQPGPRLAHPLTRGQTDC